MKTFLNFIPNAAVFVLLAGIFYFGYITDWKMPKFSELTGHALSTESDWCGDHLVPESQCIECKPNLLPKEYDFGYCKEHGVAQCVIHHPELAQLPAGQIPTANLPKYNTADAVNLIHRQRNNPADTLHSKRVQFTSKESVEKSGITVDIVREGEITETLTANGELIFDPNRVVLLSSKVSGTVDEVLKIIGNPVKAGEILALVDASQIGLLKSEFVKNFVQLELQKDNVERLTPLTASKAVSVQEMLQATTALQEAEVNLLATRQQFTNLGFILPQDFGTKDPEQLSEKLRFLGIPQNIVETLPSKNANLFPLVAPFDGVITESTAVRGKVVEASHLLFTVCDTRKMWIMLDVRQEDIPYVKQGQSLVFHSDNGKDTATGTVSWLNPAVDEKTRTLKVRAEVDNSDGKLRGNTFGFGNLILRQEKNAVLVPLEAVQATADVQFVFVRDKDYFAPECPKIFYPRQVVLGAKGEGINAGKVEILAGVLPGEIIAVKGSNVLLAHLLRSNLGAGCCAED
ncbi:MAG: efflux RND transporter periplasmic adaptor subunit [Planctomycetaceae bacterium]|jgi:cobalt-zinc-cadmium efflux system membrane fusion protein|nr:efflux RND transporter periplasmic adaptor subunit [Planctomycetaceae bacterium]